MFDDTWYSFVSNQDTNNTSSKYDKQSRKELSLKQSDSPHVSDQLPKLPVIDQKLQSWKSLSTVVSAKRSKSCSDIHEANTTCIEKEVESSSLSDIEDISGQGEYNLESYDECEDELLEQNLEEYKLYRDHLELSERHLDRILVDTTSALDYLATLYESFKSIELETTAFQGQCEDLLAEQKILMNVANEVGTSLQYYAYLEPLTRRLNAAEASRLVESEDFLEILLNLNFCIEFMEQHPSYRDSSTYKTRYLSLLDKSLNLVLKAFSNAFKDVNDDVVEELRSKDHNETSEYILLYGKYESIQLKLGSQIEKLLKTEDFAFGKKGDEIKTTSYILQYHELWSQILDVYIKSREVVTRVVSKNLKKFVTTEKPDTDFQTFARHAVQYVLDICHNEQSLMTRYFQNGPLLAEYGKLTGWSKNTNYAVRLEENVLSHLKTLHASIYPYLENNDLQRVCDLVNWLETMYLISTDDEYDIEPLRNDRAILGQAYLRNFLWKSRDDLFIKAAIENENYY